MTDLKFKEDYFKLKNDCSKLNNLLRAALNELKISKKDLHLEKEKYFNLRNDKQTLSEENKALNEKIEDLENSLENLTKENDYLKKYTKAVESVAEEYCDERIQAEKKIKDIKRKSSIILSKVGKMDLKEFDIFEKDDNHEYITITKYQTKRKIEDIVRCKFEETIRLEKEKSTLFKDQNASMKEELSNLKSQKNNLNEELFLKTNQIHKLEEELKIAADAYTNLKEDHEKMMNCFSPLLKLARENEDLKRTSSILLNEMSSDDKLSGALQSIEFQQEEINKLNDEICQLKSKSEEETKNHELLAELASLRIEIEDIQAQLETANKEKLRLDHENRILLVQRTGTGTVPPAPPPPPPPPPPVNPLVRIFTKKTRKSKPGDHIGIAMKPEAVKADAMLDLITQLKKRIEKRSNIQNDEFNDPANVLRKTSSTDETNETEISVRIRSKSLGNLGLKPLRQESTELEKLFKKRKNKIKEIDSICEETSDKKHSLLKSCSEDTSNSQIEMNVNECDDVEVFKL